MTHISIQAGGLISRQIDEARLAPSASVFRAMKRLLSPNRSRVEPAPHKAGADGKLDMPA